MPSTHKRLASLVTLVPAAKSTETQRALRDEHQQYLNRTTAHYLSTECTQILRGNMMAKIRANLNKINPALGDPGGSHARREGIGKARVNLEKRRLTR